MSTTESFVATRVYDATPEQIWSAFTTPEKIAGFFGPEGVTVKAEEVTFEAEVGGTFSLTMHNEALGQGFPLVWKILELEAPNKLKFETQRQGIITIEFREVGDSGKTYLTWTAESTTGPMEDDFYNGMVLGVHSNLDLLGKVLAS